MSERFPDEFDSAELEGMFDQIELWLNPAGAEVQAARAELVSRSYLDDIREQLVTAGHDELICGRQLYEAPDGDAAARTAWRNKLSRLMAELTPPDDELSDDALSDRKIRLAATSHAYDECMAAAALCEAIDIIQPRGLSVSSLSRDTLFAEDHRRFDGDDVRIAAAHDRYARDIGRELGARVQTELAEHLEGARVTAEFVAEFADAVIRMGADWAIAHWKHRREITEPACARQMRYDGEVRDIQRKVAELCAIADTEHARSTAYKWIKYIMARGSDHLSVCPDLALLAEEWRQQQVAKLENIVPVVNVPECFDSLVYCEVLDWVAKQQYRDCLQIYFDATGQLGNSQLHASKVVQNGIEKAMIELGYGFASAVTDERRQTFIDAATRDMLETEIFAGSTEPTKSRDDARLIMSMIDRAYAEAKIFIECRREAERK